MAKPKAKAKKTNKLAFLSKFRNPKILVLLVFVLGFGGFGVYKLAFSSAATYPPDNLTWRNVLTTAATGGGKIYCPSAMIDTGYGPLVYNCVHEGTGPVGMQYPTQVGNYSRITKTFYKTQDSVSRTTSSVQSIRNNTCTNYSNTYFTGSGVLKTGYGNLSYGYVYLWYGKWLIKPATFARTDNYRGTCYPSGEWKEAKPW